MNFKFNGLFIFILTLTFSISQKNDKESFLRMPFNIEFDKESSISGPEEIKTITKLSTSLTVSEAWIGTPSKKIKMNLSSKYSYMYFINSTLDNDRIKGYNSKLSSTYQTARWPKGEGFDEIEDYSQFQDYMTCCLDSIAPSNYYLVIVNQFKKEFKKKNGGMLGLNVDRGKNLYDFNIINILKVRNNTSQYDFFFKYDSDFGGDLILGACPYNLTTGETEENNYMKVKVEKINNALSWSTKINVFSFGNEIQDYTNGTLLGLFSFDDYMITAPDMYINLFREKFFKEYLNDNKCFERNLENYLYFYCDIDGIDYSKFEKIKFKFYQDFPKNTTFTFEEKDLFHEDNDHKYFLIRFFQLDPYPEPTWVFGQKFLSKYIISFNQDSKTIMLPRIVDEDEEVRREKEEETGRGSTAAIVILSILVFVLLCVVIRFLYHRKIKKERRVRATELADDIFIYEKMGVLDNK